MKVSLPIRSFSFFKVSVGSLFLITALVSPFFAGLAVITALVVGRAHSVGAWLAMWRANKLNLVYVSWMTILIVSISFWGFRMVTLATLGFLTSILFYFHFLFDEFDLQETKRTIGNGLSIITPTVIGYLFLFQNYFYHYFHLPFMAYLILAGVFWAIELIFLKEINWFFIQTKIISLFVLFSIFFHWRTWTMVGVFLMFHYFFWFIYPVYKLHKYKREERDGFILMLVLLVAGAVFYGFSAPSFAHEITDYITRSFFIGTIVHILSTAPFGYIFGLPKPQHRPAINS